MSIAVDELADAGYTNRDIPETYIDPQRRSGRYILVETGHHTREIRGKTRKQLKAECIMDNAVEKAGESKLTWGDSPEHIDWR